MWTPDNQSLLERFNAAYPAPQEDDACRIWTLHLAEQFAYTFPGQMWGTKRADAGRPPSTDVICTRQPFTGYDVLLNQGRPNQTLAKNPAPIDLTGQVFITVVPTNHLGATPPPAPPPQPYPSEVEWWGPVYEARVAQCYAEAGKVFPDSPAAFRWFSRCAYDIGTGMPKEAAMAKHVAELRAALGLP